MHIRREQIEDKCVNLNIEKYFKENEGKKGYINPLK